MNQIINLIIRQVMNQLVRRGVSAGFDQASKIGRKKQGNLPADALDDYGNPIDPRQSRAQEQSGKQASRHAQQSMKVMRRMSKF